MEVYQWKRDKLYLLGMCPIVWLQTNCWASLVRYADPVSIASRWKLSQNRGGVVVNSKNNIQSKYV